MIRKPIRQNLTNKFTDWERFREELDSNINLKVRLKTTEELEVQSKQFIDIIHEAAKSTTPVYNCTTIQEKCYPLQVRLLIKQRRKARRIWHRTRRP